jgi:hypothetical protein
MIKNTNKALLPSLLFPNPTNQNNVSTSNKRRGCAANPNKWFSPNKAQGFCHSMQPLVARDE